MLLHVFEEGSITGQVYIYIHVLCCSCWYWLIIIDNYSVCAWFPYWERNYTGLEFTSMIVVDIENHLTFTCDCVRPLVVTVVWSQSHILKRGLRCRNVSFVMYFLWPCENKFETKYMSEPQCVFVWLVFPSAKPFPHTFYPSHLFSAQGY